MQHIWCKLYKNGTDPNLENCSFLKKGSHSNYKWCMYCGYILFQTQKCSYWGKCNPNLDNCSYCEGKKPYYILKDFRLLLTWYYYNLVEVRNLLHTIPDVTKRLVVITTLCSQFIKSSKKLEPLWKYGCYLVIFLRNCFYSSCVKIGKQYFARKLLFHR